MKGKKRIVRVFDTTLRDGEQTPGVSLIPEEKLQIAQALDRLGVDVIEAGFPITSKGEQEGVRLIARAGLSAEVCALARAEKLDIDTAIQCGVDSVHVFLASSDIHLKHKLHITREEMLRKSAEGVRYAKSLGVKVEFSPEDPTRTDLGFFTRVVSRQSAGGGRPAQQGNHRRERLRTRIRDSHSRPPLQSLHLRTLRALDGRTDAVVSGGEARREARDLSPAPADGADAEGRASEADR